MPNTTPGTSGQNTDALAPHGYRAAVRELVEDARALGTWRPRGGTYTPKAGDLAISARAGGDPTKGGLGHVERVESVADDVVVTIGGNESNTWVRGPLSLTSPDLRGWIEYPAALGEAALAIAQGELAKHIVEIPGAPSHPSISGYLKGCRRDGTATAGMLGEDGNVDTSGIALGLTSDETAWCAASASACCFRALTAS